jgi:Cof subfamily protein (haloacid dehalogenase superfamily)
VLSDVDGTLVTSTKELSLATIDAVQRLDDAGIAFAVTSGRPPRGLTMLIEPLSLTTPMSAFNGGLIVDTELNSIRELTIDDELIEPIISQLTAANLSVWVYQDTDWFVLDLQGPHVARESRACAFSPEERANFDDLQGNVVKIVGVSDDPALVDNARRELNEKYASRVSATSSQTYYLDVTHRDANKGVVVDYLSQQLSIKTSEIVTIGDMSNDLLMFERAGMSIAMGNAADEVKQRATRVTSSNDENGVARAIDEFILGH